MANIRSFKELRVWQNAMVAAMQVFEFTRKFPAEERYSMTDQFRRATRSVASNIAEAWRKRRYPAAFVSKLSDAESEAAEAQTWTELAMRCRYMTQDDADALNESYEHILAQLVSMIERPEAWVVTSENSRRVAASPRRRVSRTGE